MLITFLSAKGSPGVTTSVLALATQWPRTAIAVDLDPQGGDVLTGVGGGRHPAQHGIVELLVEARTTSLLDAMGRQVIRPAPHGPLVLAGFGAPGQAIDLPWDALARQLADVPGADVLADCGRFVLGHPIVTVLHHSDLVVLVTGSSLRAARAAARALPPIRRELARPSGAEPLTMVVVGPDMPYAADEIAAGCGIDLAGTLPRDRAAATVWSDGAQPGRAFRRSRLQRVAFDLARALADRAAARRVASPVLRPVLLNGAVQR